MHDSETRNFATKAAYRFPNLCGGRIQTERSARVRHPPIPGSGQGQALRAGSPLSRIAGKSAERGEAGAGGSAPSVRSAPIYRAQAGLWMAGSMFPAIGGQFAVEWNEYPAAGAAMLRQGIDRIRRTRRRPGEIRGCFRFLPEISRSRRYRQRHPLLHGADERVRQPRPVMFDFAKRGASGSTRLRRKDFAGGRETLL